MKTTLMFRQIANPRRTTLAHLTDATDLVAARDTGTEEAGTAAETGTVGRPLPQRTANPRRTVLNELPKAPIAP
ncbi:hypothetical protein OG552_26345 [Streptomyces sp. NBC_01476]|uniref:hypothetical protein n=1 Tax=Streptomyces sp. NBC_01476 TaxID=2903881 RepID=UPI002E31FB0C|nr:hypothetical protein [Streptomyces sp. NBC_01476]